MLSAIHFVVHFRKRVHSLYIDSAKLEIERPEICLKINIFKNLVLMRVQNFLNQFVKHFMKHQLYYLVAEPGKALKQ